MILSGKRHEKGPFDMGRGKMIHQEVMETLQMQTQMLREQLDLLAHVPGCHLEAISGDSWLVLGSGHTKHHQTQPVLSHFEVKKKRRSCDSAGYWRKALPWGI